MQITPRYDGPPVLRLDVPRGDPAVPLLRQRRRLADLLAGFTEDQWAAPTRCDRWTVREVIAHLVGTNQFWTMSITAGLAGEPTRILTAFDPVSTPALLVDGMKALPSSEVLVGYVDSVEAMAAAVDGLDDAGWSTPAEAPPGLVALHAVVLHALWDGWIHERDIALPLGLAPSVEDDEVIASLQYVAALGPAFLASSGSTRRGTLTVEATDPDVSFVVEAGPTVVVREGEADGPRLRGDAVALVEGLSFRAPLDPLDHDLGEDDRWLLGGLGEVFDVSPAG